MNKLFKGIEAEGPLKGKRTLFVQGHVAQDTIDKYLANIEHIYFGAGELSAVDIRTVEHYSRYSDLLITVETDTINLTALLVNKNVYHMLPLVMRGNACYTEAAVDLIDTYLQRQQQNVIVKIDTGNNVCCCMLNDFLVNDNTAYEDDVDI